MSLDDIYTSIGIDLKFPCYAGDRCNFKTNISILQLLFQIPRCLRLVIVLPPPISCPVVLSLAQLHTSRLIKSKYIKPCYKRYRSGSIRCSFYIMEPRKLFCSWQLEVFKHRSSLQKWGLLTSAYYYCGKPTLGELEIMSRIESNILNVFGGTIKSRPIDGKVIF